MKKLYRKGKVHPTSPPIILDHLSFLPAAILTLTAALSPEDREVLAYLISCSNGSSSSSSCSQGHRKSTQQQKNGSVSFARSKSTGNNNINNSNDHPPLFTCDCFRCYMSYWVKWDASANRQLIHEIIDAFEDQEMSRSNKKVKTNKKDKKKRSSGSDHKKNDHHQLKDQQLQAAKSESAEENRDDDGDNDRKCSNNKGGGGGAGAEEEEEKGSVRSLVSYIGERIWGVWG